MIRSKICPKAFGHTQGQKNLENWKYCPCCGEKLQTRKCEKCHQEMDIDWIYCVKCGKGDDVRIQKKMLANLDNNKQPSFSSSWEEMLEIAKAIPMGGKGI